MSTGYKHGRGLRADCGIGLLDCKKSLEACDYDYAKARVYALHVQSSRVMVTRRNAQGGLI